MPRASFKNAEIPTVEPETYEASEIAQEAGVRMSPEESALRRRLDEAQKEEMEGTEFGKLEQNVPLIERYRNAKRMTPGVDASRLRLNPQVDKFSPSKNNPHWDSEDAKKRYNHVGPGRTVVWKKRPEIYKDELDEVSEVMYDIPEAKIVTRRTDGKPLYSKDLVAISIPADYEKARQQAEVEDYSFWEEQIRQGTQHGSVTKNTPNIAELERAAAEAARVRSQRLGVGYDGNSPTAGIPLMDAERMIPYEDMVSMEARARSGNRHQSYDEIEERQNNSRSGRKTFGGLTGPADKWVRSADQRRSDGKGAKAAK